MEVKAVLGIVSILILVSIITFCAFSASNEKAGLEVVDIKVTEPNPSFLNNHFIIIDLGESVTLDVGVQNNGDNITQRNAYSVGLGVIYPDKGANYWQLPSEQLIQTDLGPGGKSSHTFRVKNRKEVPFTGKFELQAYIKSLDTGEEIDRSDKVTIEIRYPA
jgi:hypothetical protein